MKAPGTAEPPASLKNASILLKSSEFRRESMFSPETLKSESSDIFSPFAADTVK